MSISKITLARRQCLSSLSSLLISTSVFINAFQSLPDDDNQNQLRLFSTSLATALGFLLLGISQCIEAYFIHYAPVDLDDETALFVDSGWVTTTNVREKNKLTSKSEYDSTSTILNIIASVIIISGQSFVPYQQTTHQIKNHKYKPLESLPPALRLFGSFFLFAGYIIEYKMQKRKISYIDNPTRILTTPFKSMRTTAILHLIMASVFLGAVIIDLYRELTENATHNITTLVGDGILLTGSSLLFVTKSSSILDAHYHYQTSQKEPQL